MGAGGWLNSTSLSDVGVALHLTNLTLQWYNGTYFGRSHSSGNRVDFYSQDNDGAIIVDYIELRFYYLPLLEYQGAGIYSNWGTSFTNVSNWQLGWSTGLGAGDYSFTSNGDIGTIRIDCDDANDEAVRYYVAGTYPTGLYIEARAREVSPNGNMYVQMVDGATVGATLDFTSSSFTTLKAILTADCTEIRIIYTDGQNSYAGGNITCEIDYIRISPANEMGFQHDGSTTEGLWNDGDVDKSYTSATNGDIVTFGVNHTGATGSSYYGIKADDTTTEAEIESTYYLFMVTRFRITSYDMGASVFSVNWASDGYRTQLLTSSSYQNNTWVVMRLNVRASITVDTSNRGFYVYYSGTQGRYIFDVDYIIYSIANFTITQSASVAVNEYAYVTGGTLYVQKTSTNWMQFGHDPSISVDTTTFNNWSVTTTDIDPRGDAGTCFRIGLYVDGAYQTYDDLDEGQYSPGGTLTDFYMIFYANSKMDIDAITFFDNHHFRTIASAVLIFDMPNWHTIISVVIRFFAPLNTWALDMLLLFGGLIVIPSSTVYVAVNVKNKTMDSDKLFYFCVAFLLGIALFIGGIT